MARRSYGTGSLFIEHGSWYGKWRVRGQQVKRMLGPARKPGTKEGLTRSQAEKALRQEMEAETPSALSPRAIDDRGRRDTADRPPQGARSQGVDDRGL